MVQESIIIKKSSTGTTDYCKEVIRKIKGKIVREDTSKQVIFWTSRFGLQVVECETHIVNHQEGIEITTFAQTDDVWQVGAKKTIKKFYTTLFENPKIKAPNKGHTKPQPSFQKSTPSFNKKYFLIGMVVLLVGYYALIRDKLDEPTTFITQKGYYGTYTEEDLDKLYRYINDKDEVAIDQLYRNGRIILIPPNRKAFIVKSKILGTVKIRLEGNTTELWTVTEAIK
ncbi:hypothetical protein [Sinomicrobium oceani]|uniref:hypothetical protein n=1 Tax=Sinomicrobium oceani TaxID=1150368 RepID=UPI00227AF96D|nr:hypothetical protein [Sinomicrobium oceani]